MPISINELLRLNVFDCGIENVKEYTLLSTRPDLVVKGLHDLHMRRQVPIFSTLEQDYKDEWVHEDFDYKFSELGFRDTDLPAQIDLAAFGCSYTFGLGLPEHTTWHKVLAKHNNISAYNFGQPGASIKSITDMFHIVSNHVKIERAIFLLPTYIRFLIAGQRVDRVKLFSFLPQSKRTDDNLYGVNPDLFYKHIPDIEFIRKMKDDVYAIEHIAKHKNIKLFISSWDRPTYDLLKIMDFKYAKLIEEWTCPKDPSTQKDLARDKLHPGMSHHKYWAEEIQHQVFT